MGALDGKIALVTGGASGIGTATARRFAAEGATVAVADIDVEGGQAIATELGGTFLELDVTEPSHWRAAFERLLDTHGRLDVAHLNAGVHPGVSDLTQYADETYRRHVAVNVDGVFFGMRAALEAMRAQEGGGAVVVTSSLAGLIAYPIDPVYNLTKHAVVGLVRGVAPVAGRGITVNSVNPGIVDTPMLGEAKALLEAAGFPAIPPEDVAQAVLWAATSGRTGEAWVVQPGRIEPFNFPNVPGPRAEGAEGRRPPISPA